MKVRLVVVSLLALFAGCSSTSQPEASASPETIPVVGIPNYASPIHRAVLGRPGEWAVRNTAEKEAVAACMLERGWRGFGPNLSLVELPETVEEHHAFGEQFGYGITTQLEIDRATVPASEDPSAPFWDSLSADERERVQKDLWSPPDADVEGCVYVGHKAAWGSLLLFSNDYLDAQSESGNEVRADPEFVAVLRAWAECVREQGEQFDSQDAIIKYLSKELAGIENDLGRLPTSKDPAVQKLMRREMTLFGIDTRCDAEVGYTTTYFTVQDRIEAEYVDDPVFADNSLPPLPSD